jgi:hypothetical protein
MATVTIKLPDEFMNQLSEFDSRLEDVFTKSLEDGAEIAEKQARVNLKNSLSGKSSGQLLGALGTSPVKPSSLGGFDIRVGFAEPRKKKSGATTYSKKLKSGKVSNYEYTNEMVANILEYGKKGQAAKPFMKPAEDATKSKVKAKMEETFKAEAEKIFK